LPSSGSTRTGFPTPPISPPAPSTLNTMTPRHRAFPVILDAAIGTKARRETRSLSPPMSPSLRRLADAVGQTEETATLLKNAARCPNRVTGGKTRSEYIFSELPQVADTRRNVCRNYSTHRRHASAVLGIRSGRRIGRRSDPSAPGDAGPLVHGRSVT